MAVRIKGVVLIPALLLFALIGYATDSGPSNTVGFWKLDVHPGYTHVSFPLLPSDKTLNNVLGSQLTGGTSANESDQVLRWNASTQQFQMSWYNTSTSSWQGDFSQFSEKESYWIYVQPAHPQTQTLVAFGGIIETPSYNMGTMSAGYNAIGSVWAMAAALSSAGLTGFTGGNYLFQSDLIMGYDATAGSYAYAWKNTGGTWQGNLSQLEPLKGYWLYVAPGHSSFNWSSYPRPIPSGLNGASAPTQASSAPLGIIPPTPANPDADQAAPPLTSPPKKGGIQ